MRKAANMKHAAKLSLAAVLLAVAVGGCSDSKPNWKWKFWEKAESVPVEFKIGEPKPAAGLDKQTVPGSNRPVYVHPKAMLTNADIASAKVVSGDNGHVIEVVFTEDGKKAFGRLTQDSINKHLVIIADGKGSDTRRSGPHRGRLHQGTSRPNRRRHHEKIACSGYMTRWPVRGDTRQRTPAPTAFCRRSDQHQNRTIVWRPAQNPRSAKPNTRVAQLAQACGAAYRRGVRTHYMGKERPTRRDAVPLDVLQKLPL